MIKNIIFDLGDVIINIDPSRTFRAIEQLLHLDQHTQYDYTSDPIWHQHELGKVSDSELINYLYKKFSSKNSDYTHFEQNFIFAWNQLLLDIPLQRLELLRNLRKKYKLYLLSNTNQTHIDEINRYLIQDLKTGPLESYFDYCYYSYQIQLRKPDPKIYQYILSDANLNPSECFFLDDKPENIDAAMKCGINSQLVTKHRNINLILQDF
jgi:putative hydrolase of the HAD superfamily